MHPTTNHSKRHKSYCCMVAPDYGYNGCITKPVTQGWQDKLEEWPDYKSLPAI